MKKLILLIPFITCLWAGISQVPAQEQPQAAEVTLDLLRAPLSPAANLLGISNSQIEKPTDAAAFMASVQTASSNFTTLPFSYAVDIAPGWLFAGNKIRIEDYLSPKVKKSIPQSFVLSFATNTVEGQADTVPDMTRLSAGIKVSLLRGKVSSQTTEQLDKLGRILIKLGDGFDAALDSAKRADNKYLLLDSLYVMIISDQSLTFEEKDMLTKPLRDRMLQIEDSMSADLRNQLSADFERARMAAEEVRVLRYGFKLDLAAGIVWDFPGTDFDKGRTSNMAAWLSGGYESKGGFSVLALARYMYFHQAPFSPDEQTIIYCNNNAIDAGARLLYSNPASRFSASAEGIYRSMLANEVFTPESTWRVTMNLEYEVGKNKRLTLIIGRDFDGTLTGDGSLIAALNFLMGFGTSKKL